MSLVAAASNERFIGTRLLEDAEGLHHGSLGARHLFEDAPEREFQELRIGAATRVMQSICTMNCLGGALGSRERPSECKREVVARFRNARDLRVSQVGDVSETWFWLKRANHRPRLLLGKRPDIDRANGDADGGAPRCNKRTHSYGQVIEERNHSWVIDSLEVVDVQESLGVL